MVNKSTHESYRIDLFAPIIKQSKGNYLAILSDDSVDRDEERVGKIALEKIAKTKGYLAALLDHENKVLNQVAKWENLRIQEIGKNTALIAEPVFFESNPNARIIKGMLDEGAELGISIGAIVKEYDDIKYENKVYRTFTDLELVEASFVAVPSNRHGKAMAVAKSYNKGVKKMSELTQKDLDIALEKKSEELNKLITEKDTELTELKKQLEEKSVELEKSKQETEKQVEQLQSELEKTKKEALEKQKFIEQGEQIKTNNEDLEKNFADGKIPIARL